MLLDQATDVLHLGAGTHGDPAFARTADQLRVAALGRGHGIDDGFHLLELFLCRALGIAHLRQVHTADVRQLVHEATEAAHVLHLLQLIAEVFEVEALALLQLLGQLVGLVLVECRFGLFDQAEHVAHAKDPRSDTLRVERLKGFGLLAHTDELDRLAGDGTNGQCGTATGVAVDLGQDHTGQRQRIAEGLGRVGGVLTGHGVDHEQRFDRVDRGVQRLDLAHHLFVDVQTTGGIDDDHINKLKLCFFNSRLRDVDRLLAQVGREERHADVVGQGFQLLDRRRTVNVRGHHHHRLLLALFKEARKFTGGGGFTGALQTGHQYDGGRNGAQVQVFVGRAHQAFEFGLDDLHERLTRRQAARHLGADSAFLDRIDEVLDHRQGDVGFEQRHAHFAQGVFDVVLGQFGLAGDMAQRLRETVG